MKSIFVKHRFLLNCVIDPDNIYYLREKDAFLHPALFHFSEIITFQLLENSSKGNPYQSGVAWIARNSKWTFLFLLFFLPFRLSFLYVCIVEFYFAVRYSFPNVRRFPGLSSILQIKISWALLSYRF